MDKHPWDDLDTELPFPGTVTDTGLGVKGPAESLPDGDADREEDFDAEDSVD